jgi:MYXO-CTERM domain-containing protein
VSLKNQCEACLSANSCAPPMLRDKGDTRSECTYLREDVNRFEGLCAVALISVESIANCVHRHSSGCVGDSTNGFAQVEEAVLRLKTQSCRAAIDGCLASANGRSSGSFSSGGGRTCDTSASTSASRKVALLFGPLAFVLLFSRRRRACAPRS